MDRYSIALGKPPPQYTLLKYGKHLFYNAKEMYDYMYRKGSIWKPIIADPPVMSYSDGNGGSVEIGIDNYNKTKKFIPQAKVPKIR